MPLLSQYLRGKPLAGKPQLSSLDFQQVSVPRQTDYLQSYTRGVSDRVKWLVQPVSNFCTRVY